MINDYLDLYLEREKKYKPHVMIPHKLLDVDLNPTAQLLYIKFLVLVTKEKSYTVQATYKFFIQNTCSSRMTIYRALKELQYNNLIKRISTAGKCGTYIVNKDMLNDWMFKP